MSGLSDRCGGAGARFCPVCGTSAFHTEEGEDQSVGVAVGAFADATFPARRVSVCDSRPGAHGCGCREARQGSREIRSECQRALLHGLNGHT